MSLKRKLYEQFGCTHDENNRRFYSSGVRNVRNIEDLTIREVFALANEYDVTIADMIEILCEPSKF